MARTRRAPLIASSRDVCSRSRIAAARLDPRLDWGVPEIKAIAGDPRQWLEEWAGRVGTSLEDGLCANPGYVAFAREGGTVYHTYAVTAPDPFVALYHSFLLACTPKAPPEEPRALRKDECPDCARVVGAA